MHKTYLPTIINSTFDQEKLSTLLQKLWVDTTMNPDNWYTIEYDSNWTIGLYAWGSTVMSYIYLEHRNLTPTTNQLIEVINCLPKDKYEYRKESFYIMNNKRYGTLKEKGM